MRNHTHSRIMRVAFSRIFRPVLRLLPEWRAVRKRTVFVAPAILLFLITLPSLPAEARAFKLAIVLPDGSAGVKRIREEANKIKIDTNSEADIKVYAGGVAGDELDVLRKMKVNRIDIGAISSIGLRRILPKITLFEIPGIISTYEELDAVREKLYSEFEADFEKQGYVLLGLVEVGIVYFFSRDRIEHPDDFRKLKMWTWKGDQVMQMLLENFHIPVIPLPITDVRLALRNDMVNSVISPAMVINAFQWQDGIRFMFDLPHTNVAGAFLVNKHAFCDLSEKSRAIMKESFRRYAKYWVDLVRRDNEDARRALAGFGVHTITPNPEDLPLYNDYYQKLEKDVVALGAVSQADVDRVKKLVREYRQSKPKR